MVSKDSFLAALKRGTFSHAYLFVGSNGEEFRQMVQLVRDTIGSRSFDIHDIAEEGSISIETIRRLRSQLALKPHSSKHHLVVIAEAQALTPEAQNALLKLLEEPLSPTIYLLFTPDAQRLLPTVVSRCHQVELARERDVPSVLPELAGLDTVSLKEQFDLAQELSKDPDLVAVLDAWTIELRKRLLAGDAEVTDAIRSILEAKRAIEATQANRRLVLEDLFLRMR